MRIFAGALLFVLAFSLVFTLLGSAFGVVGTLLKANKALTQRFAGIVIVIMGAFMAGLIKIPALNKEARFLPTGRRFGIFSAFPLGMAFAVGWTPCIGPILAVIYTLALNAPGKGASLLLVYSLGLGIPFIVSGLLFAKAAGTIAWFKRHSQTIYRLSGGLLVIIGLLILTGRWAAITAPLQRFFRLPI